MGYLIDKVLPLIHLVKTTQVSEIVKKYLIQCSEEGLAYPGIDVNKQEQFAKDVSIQSHN